VIKQRVAKDNRSHQLTLTDSGSKMYQQLIPIALEHEQQVIETLSKDEHAQLLLLLDKLDSVQLKFNQ
jgi:DNA-binding MarR family transcriptional regulator